MLEFIALKKIQAVIHTKFKYLILYKYVKMYVKFSVYRLIINIFNKKISPQEIFLKWYN